MCKREYILNRCYEDGEGRSNGGGSGSGSGSKEILLLSSLVGELEDEEDDEFDVVVKKSFDGFTSLFSSFSSSSQTTSAPSLPILADFKRAGIMQLQKKPTIHSSSNQGKNLVVPVLYQAKVYLFWPVDLPNSG